MPLRRCRSCDASLDHEVVDLGAQPLANAFLREEDLDRMEPTWPLRAWVCGACLLVQLEAFEAPERIFSEYPYFSSVSTSWLEHARRFAELAIDRLGLGAGSRVVEIASNDGYLLQYFAAAGVSVLGVEPAANVARAAAARGIPTRIEFFGAACADRLVGEGVRADLLVANNVLAHVPDLHDFVEGLRRALAPGGVFCAEFPHLLRLLQENQFDTIYHEHFSYLSLLSLEPVLEGHGLRIFDVEELPTHGGSLRIHAAQDGRAVSPRVEALRRLEHEAGLHRLDVYTGFGARVRQVKRRLLEMLIGLKSRRRLRGGLRRPREGQHAAQLLRHRARLPRLRGGPEPREAGSLPAGHATRRAPARARARDAAGLPARAAVEPPGGGRRADVLHPGVGRSLHRPDPGAEDAP